MQVKETKLTKLVMVFSSMVVGVILSLALMAYADNKKVEDTLPVEELRSLAEVFGAIKQGYVEPMTDKKILQNAMVGMMDALDPHSDYLDMKSFKDLKESTSGQFAGLGLEVMYDSGMVKVISPIEDTPASEAGIRSGDYISRIDDTDVQTISLGKAVKLMRGEPDTKVKLKILRKGSSEPLEMTLTRKMIKVKSVRSKLLEPGYGYVRITQFQQDTIPSLLKNLEQLDGHADLKGLVIDMRNNPGGLLTGAIGVSSAFLPKGSLVVSTKGRLPDADHEYRVDKKLLKDALSAETTASSKVGENTKLFKSLDTLPLVVLINGGTASASEIVSGALQDQNRAVIMGTSSFGKGSVQTVMPLSDGKTAIKLTTALYYTPKGTSIQAMGIVPDIEVNETEKGSARRLKESDLLHHIAHDEAVKKEGKEVQDKSTSAKEKTSDKPKSTTESSNSEDKTQNSNVQQADSKDNKDKTDKEERDYLLPNEIGTDKDYQLKQALAWLKHPNPALLEKNKKQSKVVTTEDKVKKAKK